MIIVFAAIGLILLALAFIFRQMVLAFVAGLAFIGLVISGWNTRAAPYDIYGLLAILGIVLLLVSFVCGFLIQHQAGQESSLRQQRYDKEFPPPSAPLSEEEVYSQELDREIGSSPSVQSRRQRARNLIERYQK